MIDKRRLKQNLGILEHQIGLLNEAMISIGTLRDSNTNEKERSLMNNCFRIADSVRITIMCVKDTFTEIAEIQNTLLRIEAELEKIRKK